MSDIQEDLMLSNMEQTACGYFVIVSQEYKCWQGFFIDRILAESAPRYIHAIQSGNRDLTKNSLPAHLTKLMVGFFVASGVHGKVPHRSLKRSNELEIGINAAALRQVLNTDYFWVDAEIDVVHSRLGGTVHKVEARSLREGRKAVMDVPVIRRLIEQEG